MGCGDVPLRVRHVEHRIRALVEGPLLHIADDANDFAPWRFGLGGAQSGFDPLADRILIREVLAQKLSLMTVVRGDNSVSAVVNSRPRISGIRIERKYPGLTKANPALGRFAVPRASSPANSKLSPKREPVSGSGPAMPTASIPGTRAIAGSRRS